MNEHLYGLIVKPTARGFILNALLISVACWPRNRPQRWFKEKRKWCASLETTNFTVCKSSERKFTYTFWKLLLWNNSCSNMCHTAILYVTGELFFAEYESGKIWQDHKMLSHQLLCFLFVSFDLLVYITKDSWGFNFYFHANYWLTTP